MPSPIDITDESTIILSGVEIPVALISVLARADYNRIVIESDDASHEEVEVRRNGTGFDFIRHPRSKKGTDAQPVENEFRAEMVSANGQSRQWVDRGSSEHLNLLEQGWSEKGRTRARATKPTVPEERIR